MINEIIEHYKRINAAASVEWLYRIVFTLSFAWTAIVIPEEHYPDVCWGLLLISFWCYFLKWRIPGLIPLLMVLLIHYVHLSLLHN